MEMHQWKMAEVMLTGMLVALLMVIGICILVSSADHPDSMTAAEQLEVERYVECVNSRSPVETDAQVRVRRVNRALQQGSLTPAGMVITYNSLGCGGLTGEKEEPGKSEADTGP